MIDITKLGLKKEPLNSSIDELTHESDGKVHRALVLRTDVVDSYKTSPEGLKIALYYTTLIGAGAPPHVCLTVTALRAVPHLAAGIDADRWLDERSGWSEEDKNGLRELLSAEEVVEPAPPAKPDFSVN